MRHQHTADCYASNENGALAYTPCRKDGLDCNLTNMNRVDFEAHSRMGGTIKGLTLICEIKPGEREPVACWRDGCFLAVDSKGACKVHGKPKDEVQL